MDYDSGLITEEELCETTLFESHYHSVLKAWPDLNKKRQIHETIRRMINELTVDLVTNSIASINQATPLQIDDVRHFNKPLIMFSEKLRAKNLEMKRFLRDHLYQHNKVYRMTAKADRMVKGLFNAFMEDPLLLPHDKNQRRQLQHEDKSILARRVADYVAGMTDRFAIIEYEAIYSG